MRQRAAHIRSHQQQAGVMLIEALIAILIFSVGILGLVGLQASATSISTDSKYRSEAALIANDLIATMWTSNRSNLALTAAYSSPGGPAYTAWLAANVVPVLPGAAANPPVIVVTPTGSAATGDTSLVTITINWVPPDKPTVIHNYTISANIGV
jgi:type IV pilus assembly protein PilV